MNHPLAFVCVPQQRAMREVCLASLKEEFPGATAAQLEEGLNLVMPNLLDAANSQVVKRDVVNDLGVELRAIFSGTP